MYLFTYLFKQLTKTISKYVVLKKIFGVAKIAPELMNSTVDLQRRFEGVSELGR